MSRREQWRRVLDREVKRLSALSCDQLVSALPSLEAYEVEFESKKYQVEVEILENTAEYLHVGIGVDDGSLPASIFPASDSFILRRGGPAAKQS